MEGVEGPLRLDQVGGVLAGPIRRCRLQLVHAHLCLLERAAGDLLGQVEPVGPPQRDDDEVGG